MPPAGLFSPVPFYPLIHFVLLNPFVLLHVTLCFILLPLYNKHNTNIHAPRGIRTRNPSKRATADLSLRPRGPRVRLFRTHNPSKRAAVDPHLRPRGHWDRQKQGIPRVNISISHRTIPHSVLLLKLKHDSSLDIIN